MATSKGGGRGMPRIDNEETRAFYQERLGLFAKMMFIIDAMFFAGVLGVYQLYPETAPRLFWINHILGFLGLFLLLLVWRGLLKSPKRTLEQLLFIDAFMVTVMSLLFAVLCFTSYDREVNQWSTFIWTVFMIFGRVLYVPSSAKRTAVLSSLGLGLIAIAGAAVAIWKPDELSVPGPVWAMGATFYGAVAVLIATVGSQVIYGLRSQVRAAQQLGQYTLGRKIGEGGMGAVYEAHHALLRRPTAVKLLLPDKAGKDSITRFEREVQITAELNHPNTVAIFDYGRSSEGVFYYAMEYLDGLDLDSLVDLDGPQEAARVVHILLQVSGALEEAHARELIHRDIKPANILLCEMGGVPDVAKVVDFGLVKELKSGTETTASLAAGTPAFISPEAVMSPEDVGPPSDIYALGAVAYFLLSGSMLFDAKTAMEMCVHHVRTPPTPLRERAEVEISTELEALIMRCLAKKTTDRPGSAAELRRELKALPEAGAWSEERASQWWRAQDRGKLAEAKGGTLTRTPSTRSMMIQRGGLTLKNWAGL